MGRPKKDWGVCVFCGGKLRKQQKRYCSRSCMAFAYQRAMVGAGNPNFKAAGERVCAQCGVQFFSYGTRKYCSQDCYALAATPRLRALAAASRGPSKPAKELKLLAQRGCKGCLAHITHGAGRYCEACRAAGKNRKRRTGPLSECSSCGIGVDVRARKYCDECWRAAMARHRGMPRRVDANHGEIVAALRQVGCHVLDLSATGGGVPDVLVSDRAGVYHLIEIKTKTGRVNKLQKKWHEEWRGGPVHVVRSVAEALRVVGVEVAA